MNVGLCVLAKENKKPVPVQTTFVSVQLNAPSSPPLAQKMWKKNTEILGTVTMTILVQIFTHLLGQVKSPPENWWMLILDTDRNPEGTTWEWCVYDRLLPHVDEHNLQRTMSAVRGIRSALSSRLTAGYLHMCAVKEQRAGGGSEVKCMALKLHSTAVQPSRSVPQWGFILFNLPWTKEAGSSGLTGGSGIHVVACETYYLIALRPFSQMTMKVLPLWPDSWRWGWIQFLLCL